MRASHVQRRTYPAVAIARDVVRVGLSKDRGAARLAENQPATISVKAVDAATGEMRWDAELEQGLDIHLDVGGVLSTDGGLAFVGEHENLRALDADTGKERWRLNLGGPIKAGPIAYAIDGREYIAVMAGRSLFAFAIF